MRMHGLFLTAHECPTCGKIHLPPSPPTNYGSTVPGPFVSSELPVTEPARCSICGELEGNRIHHETKRPGMHFFQAKP